MRRALATGLMCAAWLACSSDNKSGGTKTVPQGPSRDARAAAPASPIPGTSRQLVVGVTESWDAHAVELRVFERKLGGPWRQVGTPWAGHVGKTGLGWGRGLHGAGMPAGTGGPVKREGDGKAAAGVFRIGSAYGYAAAAIESARIPYHQVTDTWRCVDDVTSDRYNTIFDAAKVPETWRSAEPMRRDDELYRWVIDIEHNTPKPQAGAGSCIFFHVWRGAGQPTVGCTAMPQARIESLLGQLDPAAKPVYVALPRRVYGDLAARWQLPKL